MTLDTMGQRQITRRRFPRTGSVDLASRGGRFTAMRRLLHDRAALAAVVFLCALLLATLSATTILPLDAVAQSADVLQGPTLQHWLGTDEFGRDIAARLIVGARVSLEVGFGSAAFAAVVGVTTGLVAGYLGGWWDAVPMRIMDVALALPDVVLALVIVAALGNTNVNLIIAIGIAFIPIFARVTRAAVLTVRERQYVQASKAMGAGSLDTMFRTILPNVLGPVIVQFAITAAVAIVVSAALGFLGLGPAAPAPSWGGMLQTAKSYLYQNPWYAVFPGVALMLTVLCLDRIGNGLRVAMGIQTDVAKEAR
jgi:peptide/nickel transport system permease protein